MIFGGPTRTSPVSETVILAPEVRGNADRQTKPEASKPSTFAVLLCPVASDLHLLRDSSSSR